MTWCEAYTLCLEYNLVLAYPLNITMVEELRNIYSHGADNYMDSSMIIL